MTGTAISRNKALAIGMEACVPDREPQPQTKKMMADFLRVYEETCDYNVTSKIVGAHPKSVYQWRRNWPEFDARLREVQIRIIGQLEDVAIKLALGGDGQMIRFLLTNHMRDTYGQVVKSRVEHQGNVDFRVAGISRQEAAVELAKRILDTTGSETIAVGADGVADGSSESFAS